MNNYTGLSLEEVKQAWENVKIEAANTVEEKEDKSEEAAHKDWELLSTSWLHRTRVIPLHLFEYTFTYDTPLFEFLSIEAIQEGRFY